MGFSGVFSVLLRNIDHDVLDHGILDQNLGNYKMNERITEDIVRDALKANKIKYPKVIIEEQKSKNSRIRKLLQYASKNGLGMGNPEFIITFTEISNLIIVIECKADIKNHESTNRDRPKDYAVDGVIHYSEYLSKEFDVISIAVSGQTKRELKISHFLQICKTEATDFSINKLLPFENYITNYQQSDLKFNQDFGNLMIYSKTLNTKLHKLKIKESVRSLLISGILLALKNNAFMRSYDECKKPEELSRNLVTAITTELKEGNIQEIKIKDLKREYTFIRHHETFLSDVNVLKNIIREIDQNLNQFIKTYQYYDVLGQFYIEFLRYANSDKGLGIVLTPPHITELFSMIANVNKDSIIFDNCCGTTGFLISAMKIMIDDANKDAKKIENIRKKQLVGIEYQNDIFALACSNMFIHGDGSSSIYKGDCFDQNITNEIKNKIKPNVGFLNPPYKIDKDDIEEFEFILNNLETLSLNGTCVSIIPMSCVTATDGDLLELKKRLMKYHTLEAVFSMPNELFTNSDVCTVCVILVIKAHQPHPADKETFLGYWKDDGFHKAKKFGRYDYDNKWRSIRKKWLYEYRNRKNNKYCLSKLLTPNEEWCVEAHMETDYSKLQPIDFENTVKDYVLFELAHGESIVSK